MHNNNEILFILIWKLSINKHFSNSTEKRIKWMFRSVFFLCLIFLHTFKCALVHFYFLFFLCEKSEKKKHFNFSSPCPNTRTKSLKKNQRDKKKIAKYSAPTRVFRARIANWEEMLNLTSSSRNLSSLTVDTQEDEHRPKYVYEKNEAMSDISICVMHFYFILSVCDQFGF